MLFISHTGHIFIPELFVLDAGTYASNIGCWEFQCPTLPIDLTLFRSFPTLFSGLFVLILIIQYNLHIYSVLKYIVFTFGIFQRHSTYFQRHTTCFRIVWHNHSRAYSKWHHCLYLATNVKNSSERPTLSSTWGCLTPSPYVIGVLARFSGPQ